MTRPTAPPPEDAILAALLEHGALSVAELVQLTGRSNSTCRNHLHVLLRYQRPPWVEVVGRDAARRGIRYDLTVRGREVATMRRGGR